MAANINRVIMAGSLTRDPEMRYTPGGTGICQMGMAINRRYTKGDGTQAEDVTFVDVDAWGKTAENCAQYLRKGAPVLIEGRLRLESWEDKNTGAKRSKLSVTAELVHFLGSKGDAAPGDDDGERRTPRVPRQPVAPAGGGGGAGDDNADDDIPFRMPAERQGVAL